MNTISSSPHSSSFQKKAKNVICTVLPFSTSDKRERISTWWTDVCNKVNERKTTKYRHRMHRELEQQLQIMREERDVDDINNSIYHSPASASVAIINNTTTTSVTHIDLDKEFTTNSTVVNTTTNTSICEESESSIIRINRRVLIGKAFNAFHEQTKRNQAQALATYDQKNRDKKEQQERKKLEDIKRAEKHQDHIQKEKVQEQKRKQQQELKQRKTQKSQAQKQYANQQHQPKTQRPGQQHQIQKRKEHQQQKFNQEAIPYHSDLSPLDDNNINEEDGNKKASPEPNNDSKNNNNQPDNKPPQDTSDTDSSSAISLPKRTSAPQPFLEFDYTAQRFYKFPFDKDNNEKITLKLHNHIEEGNDIQQRPSSILPEELARSINSSFRLSPQFDSTSIRSLSLDPIIERNMPSNMDAYLEQHHFDNDLISMNSLFPIEESFPLSESPSSNKNQCQQQGASSALLRIAASFISNNNERSNNCENNTQQSDESEYLSATEEYILPALRPISHSNSNLITPEEKKIITQPLTLSSNNWGRQLQFPSRLVTDIRSAHTRRSYQDCFRNYIASKRRAAMCLDIISTTASLIGSSWFHKEKDFLEKYYFVKRNRRGALIDGVIGDGINGNVRVVAKRIGSSYNICQYAIKTIRLNHYKRSPDSRRQAIVDEIRIMNKGRLHRNIMPFEEVYYLYDTVTFVMERMTCDLYGFMKAYDDLIPQDLAVLILSEVVKGLVHLHQHIGYFHGDIKPENILLSATGQIKLTDFGLSAPCGTLREGCYGTAQYMAPEVHFSKGHDEKSDIWSLGITLLNMLNSGIPNLEKDDFFDADFLFLSIQFDTINIERGSLNSRLSLIFDYCLQRDPKERVTMTELDEYLDRCGPVYKASANELGEYIRDYVGFI